MSGNTLIAVHHLGVAFPPARRAGLKREWERQGVLFLCDPTRIDRGEKPGYTALCGRDQRARYVKLRAERSIPLLLSPRPPFVEGQMSGNTFVARRIGMHVSLAQLEAFEGIVTGLGLSFQRADEGLVLNLVGPNRTMPLLLEISGAPAHLDLVEFDAKTLNRRLEPEQRRQVLALGNDPERDPSFQLPLGSFSLFFRMRQAAHWLYA